MAGNEKPQWDSLATDAATGHLSVDRETANCCAQRCSELSTELEQIKILARGLSSVNGFGTLLPSGVTLTSKFEKKAAGGDYSLDQAIADHITTVEQMQRVFDEIEARYGAADTAATRGIESSGAGLTDRGN
ncbi:hypothetical protein [Rhodococcus sp. NPDC059234]|uniref:hypothetical protein n=1 Tax=Rhodococcus sp. NPDC059234 TaxID=3346781 RepID=UPI00366E170E